MLICASHDQVCEYRHVQVRFFFDAAGWNAALSPKRTRSQSYAGFGLKVNIAPSLSIIVAFYRKADDVCTQQYTAHSNTRVTVVHAGGSNGSGLKVDIAPSPYRL